MKEKPFGRVLARVLRPSMRMYYFVILAFAIAAIVLQYWYLALGELAVALLLFLYGEEYLVEGITYSGGVKG